MSIAKGLDEPPMAFRLWTTMGSLKVEKMKEFSPIEVRIEDLVPFFYATRRWNSNHKKDESKKRGQDAVNY